MINRINLRTPRILLGLSLLLFAALSTLAIPAVSSAADGVQANLRVVTWKGKIVFDGKARTGTTSVKPNADCLGGRTGPAREVAGPTALGLLVAASKKSKDLRPLKLTDTDFGFGICGIGGISAQNEEWWVLRQNYRDSSTGAELTQVKRNDTILLYLAKTWTEPTPDSLVLKAPAKVKKGKIARVRVLSLTSAGKRSPVQGANVRGATAPTNARGYAKVKITRKIRVVARKAGLIPSNRAVIQVKKNKQSGKRR